MTPTQERNIEERLSRLEKLVRAHIRQVQDKDWLDDSHLVKKLDQISQEEPSISEEEAEI